MKLSTVTSAIAAIVAFTAGTAQAGGLIFHLPDDGTWAQFDRLMVTSLTDQDTGESLIEDSTRRLPVRIASVGQATVDGEVCRWIEFQIEETVDGIEHAVIFKVLIPEAHLNDGGDPMNNIVRGWVKSGDDLPSPIEVADHINLRSLLDGPLQDISELEPEVIDYKADSLECEGLSGTTAWQDHLGRDFNSTHDIRLHDASPFGVVSYRVVSWIHQSDPLGNQVCMTFTSTFTLTETGIDAESELPEHN